MSYYLVLDKAMEVESNGRRKDEQKGSGGEGRGCMRIWDLFRLVGFLPVAYREGGLFVCLGLWGGWE